jgi:hypothetical protein
MTIFCKKLFTTVLLGIAICVMAALWSARTYAQTDYNPVIENYIRQEIYRNQYISKFAYESRLLQAKEAARHPEREFPFHNLVQSYAGGPDYDPLATQTIQTLYDLTYKLQHSENKDDVFYEFKTLLEKHLANYDIVTAAIPLVKDNAYLGDLKFLEWLRAGLQQRLLQSEQNGADLYSAYNIYSAGEETLILRYNNAKLIKTDILDTGNEFYHIHLVEDIRSGRPFKIYARLTEIMRGIEQQQKLADPFYEYTPRPPADFLANDTSRAN